MAFLAFIHWRKMFFELRWHYPQHTTPGQLETSWSVVLLELGRDKGSHDE